jgi:SNF2 family DNA or RNA helicase
VEKEAGRLDRPALVVATTSLIENWRREAARFTPGLSTLVVHGQRRGAVFEQIANHDLVLTTYALVPRDIEILARQPYHAIILDEAQVIKNPRSQAAQALQRLEARHRFALSGTPMENHLDELWSVYHFVLPGLLGDHKTFQTALRRPIEKGHSAPHREALVRRLRPFLLRRTKALVAPELPPKTEMIEPIALSEAERNLYETIRQMMDGKIRAEIERRGFGQSRIIILEALLKLRQVCCDARLLKVSEADLPGPSSKLARLLEMLPELIEEERKVIVFSQFTSMLTLIGEALTAAAVPWISLTGGTRDRPQVIDKFQSGAVPIFLVSLKAGGAGLNLTAADTVIHYDPWWNPAVEAQATARAHRIGQDKPVFVHKLVATGTVEEAMLELQKRKQALAEGVLDAGLESPEVLNLDDLDRLLAPIEGEGEEEKEEGVSVLRG